MCLLICLHPTSWQPLCHLGVWSESGIWLPPRTPICQVCSTPRCIGSLTTSPHLPTFGLWHDWQASARRDPVDLMALISAITWSISFHQRRGMWCLSSRKKCRAVAVAESDHLTVKTRQQRPCPHSLPNPNMVRYSLNGSLSNVGSWSGSTGWKLYFPQLKHETDHFGGWNSLIQSEESVKVFEFPNDGWYLWRYLAIIRENHICHTKTKNV